MQKWSSDATAIYPTIGANAIDRANYERSFGLDLDHGDYLWKPVGGQCNNGGPGPDDYNIGRNTQPGSRNNLLPYGSSFCWFRSAERQRNQPRRHQEIQEYGRLRMVQVEPRDRYKQRRLRHLRTRVSREHHLIEWHKRNSTRNSNQCSFHDISQFTPFVDTLLVMILFDPRQWINAIPASSKLTSVWM